MRAQIIIIQVLVVIFTTNTCIAQRSKEWQLSISFFSIDTTVGTNAVYSTSAGIDTFSLIRPLSFTLNDQGICDTSGNLLFYTNGIWIANRNHDTLLNSVNFNPGWCTDYYEPWGMNLMQMVLILPWPDSLNSYLVLNETCDVINHPDSNILINQPTHLGYSVIDMTLDGGLGGITNTKDSTLFSDTLINGRLTACKHGNGRDWWVIISKYNSNIRYKILITPQGPQLFSSQAIGHNTPDVLDYFGQACFSPDGTKYALAFARTQSVELFDFDRCSGDLSNPRFVFINDSTPGLLGCSFSPDSRFLYTSDQLYTYQLDTWSSNMDSTKQLVAIYDGYVATFQTKFLYHQLAQDGKIYINTAGGDSVLHKINNPDSLGTACDFQQHCIKLTYYDNLSLNLFPNYDLGPLTGSICDSLTSVKKIIQNAALQLKIFPNPVSLDVIFVNYLLEQNKPGTMEILNVTGQVIYSQRLPQWSSEQKVSLQKLNDGYYLMKLSSGEKTAITKFVKITK